MRIHTCGTALPTLYPPRESRIDVRTCVTPGTRSPPSVSTWSNQDRITSIGVLLALAATILTPASLFVRPPAPLTVLGAGVSFDPSAMWEQIGGLTRLSALIWIGTFLPLFVQGLRNRTLHE